MTLEIWVNSHCSEGRRHIKVVWGPFLYFLSASLSTKNVWKDDVFEAYQVRSDCVSVLSRKAAGLMGEENSGSTTGWTFFLRRGAIVGGHTVAKITPKLNNTTKYHIRAFDFVDFCVVNQCWTTHTQWLVEWWSGGDHHVNGWDTLTHSPRTTAHKMSSNGGGRLGCWGLIGRGSPTRTDDQDVEELGSKPHSWRDIFKDTSSRQFGTHLLLLDLDYVPHCRFTLKTSNTWARSVDSCGKRKTR